MSCTTFEFAPPNCLTARSESLVIPQMPRNPVVINQGGAMRRRSQKGQAVSALAVILAAFGIASLGMLAFEVSRLVVARDQLRTATEAAALAGAGALAGSLDEDVTTGQQNAVKAAKQVLAANDVIGVPLSRQVAEGSRPKEGEVALKFRLLDPKNNNAEVAFGDVKGKLLEVTAKFGYGTGTGKYIGLGAAPIDAVATGGTGDLDVAMCFDVSGSMDDASPVTFVRRTFNTQTNKMQYQFPSGIRNGQGRVTIDLRNTVVGVVPPQMLQYASSFQWSPGLRGTDMQPPREAPSANKFTDLVVNIDGNSTFGGISSGGFSFPNIATLVEASRGNLESAAIFESSGAKSTLDGIVAPQAGYKAKYLELARKQVHPLIDAQEAAQDFFKQMDRGTDGHFGFVAFQSIIGRDDNSTYRAPNIATDFSQGGNGDFALPFVQLDPADGVTNFNDIMSLIPKLVAEGGTNIGASLDAAVTDLDKHGRKNSKKVIILFTDGFPSGSSDPEGDARRAAQRAKTKNISIFTIGLSIDPSNLPEQERILNDRNSSPMSGGIAGIAGNGGKFFQTSDPGSLKSAFSKVARQLTQLTQ